MTFLASSWPPITTTTSAQYISTVLSNGRDLVSGAARITMGLNLDYPAGKPGTMGALQCFAEGTASTLPSHFEDAFQTMALVEALYRSSDLPGEPLPLDY